MYVKCGIVKCCDCRLNLGSLNALCLVFNAYYNLLYMINLTADDGGCIEYDKFIILLKK